MHYTVHFTAPDELDRLLLTRGMEARIRKHIRTVLNTAVHDLSSLISTRISPDPRHSSQAVSRLIWKSALGGNINILNPRRRLSPPTSYRPTRTLRPGQWGGNRIKPTQRTIALESYQGRDRAFILRFLNSGTTSRSTRYGNRGSIPPMRFFTSYAQSVINKALNSLSQLIDKELSKAK